MARIASLCEQIVVENAKIDRRMRDALLPGIQEAEIRQRTRFIKSSLPDAAVELYSWSEGIDPNTTLWTHVSMLPGFSVGTLAEMIDAFKSEGAESSTSRFRYLD